MTEKSVSRPSAVTPPPAQDTGSDLKWRRQPEERPQQILLAAIEVFGEHGIAAAKLEDIAARAGVSKGTIYLYFESKEDLFREVVRRVLVPRMQEVERAL
ncbi:MAG: helix-turn-helix domain-containing protein, partial [Gemmatimonadota bacterium]|nr:helix-turn-helix domain-containing protein [Gemmatimonadota bacterium]